MNLYKTVTRKNQNNNFSEYLLLLCTGLPKVYRGCFGFWEEELRPHPGYSGAISSLILRSHSLWSLGVTPSNDQQWSPCSVGNELGSVSNLTPCTSSPMPNIMSLSRSALSTAGRVLALHKADLGSIPGILYGSPKCPLGVIPKQSQKWALSTTQCGPGTKSKQNKQECPLQVTDYLKTTMTKNSLSLSIMLF